MNTQSNLPEARLDPQGTAPRSISPTRLMYWLLRRELWENRSIYVAPLAAAAVVLFGFMISMIHLPHRMRALSALDPAKQREALEQPYEIAAGLIIVTAFIVGIFFSLDALYGERRDRSILFWKSLPVSDLSTVLSKAIIPLAVLPLLSFAILVPTQLIMLLLNSAVLVGSGLSAATLWRLPLFQMSLMLLYHLLTMHVLWYAPFYGWLLLVSVWARRAPFLWAVLPPLAIGVVEKIAFNTSHFTALLLDRLSSGGNAGPDPFTKSGSVMIGLTQLTPGKFLIDPGLWMGFAVAAAFLFAAVRLRRYRGPI